MVVLSVFGLDLFPLAFTARQNLHVFRFFPLSPDDIAIIYIGGTSNAPPGS